MHDSCRIDNMAGHWMDYGLFPWPILDQTATMYHPSGPTVNDVVRNAIGARRVEACANAVGAGSTFFNLAGTDDVSLADVEHHVEVLNVFVKAEPYGVWHPSFIAPGFVALDDDHGNKLSKKTGRQQWNWALGEARPSLPCKQTEKIRHKHKQLRTEKTGTDNYAKRKNRHNQLPLYTYRHRIYPHMQAFANDTHTHKC